MKVSGVGERGAYGAFEGGAEVRDNCIDRGEGVDHHVERRMPRSAYHRGSSSLNGWTVDEAISPYQNWHHCGCGYVPWLLGVKGPDRETN